MDRDECAFVAFYLIAIIVMLAGAYWLSSSECQNKWKGSGMDSEYGLIQGCLITLKDGRKIPAENYREL